MRVSFNGCKQMLYNNECVLIVYEHNYTQDQSASKTGGNTQSSFCHLIGPSPVCKRLKKVAVRL